ncbi:hypothetical protein POVWA2_058100 [Plasmodium ovale wallikeri]|uniref:Uncharacterized protein n=1 Tax=Plasmodium ovale wallikeri TaxID=864142 RepID=A0A1A8ZYV6_PLAOA|nr:hypothetical protein POVWA1_058800 [Plasmodium ovale wallikeri]SBT49415.1 hypothetical protein POVWA2_058100 [Plasmodium ovale wallikeri]
MNACSWEEVRVKRTMNDKEKAVFTAGHTLANLFFTSCQAYVCHKFVHNNVRGVARETTMQRRKFRKNKGEKMGKEKRAKGEKETFIGAKKEKMHNKMGKNA